MPFPALILAATLIGAAAFAPYGDAWCQSGTLVSHAKISSPVLAGVGATLDNGDEFGDAVAGLGDLDGPGPAAVALAVSAILDDDGGKNRGAVYILFLDGAGTVLSQRKISSTQGGFTGTLANNDEFGSALAWLGDLDGPGPSVGALAVGVINDTDGGTSRGAVYVLFLDATGAVLSHQKISSTQGGFTGTLDNLDEFGGALAGLGDLDGPGPSVAALAVSANRDDDGGPDRGAVYILFLDAAGGVISHQKISSTEGNLPDVIGDNDFFGEDLASLGDLDGPGPSVLALASTAVGDDDGGNDRGAAHILFLDAAGKVLSHQKISSTQGGFLGPVYDDDNFGSAVAGLGDLDGPGASVAALAVSAAAADGPGVDRGTVFVLFLSASGTVVGQQEIGSTTGGLNGEIDDTDEFGAALAALPEIAPGAGSALTLVSGVGSDDDGGPDRGAAYLLSLQGNSIVGVGDTPVAVHPAGLWRVGPNPFTRETAVAFRLAEAGRVRIDVLDARGRVVRRLARHDTGPGEHTVSWDGLDDSGRPPAPGVYFLRMSVDGRAQPSGASVVLLR